MAHLDTIADTIAPNETWAPPSEGRPNQSRGRGAQRRRFEIPGAVRDVVLVESAHANHIRLPDPLRGYADRRELLLAKRYREALAALPAGESAVGR